MSGVGIGLVVKDIDGVLVNNKGIGNIINEINGDVKTEEDILERIAKQVYLLKGRRKEEVDEFLYSDIKPIPEMIEIASQLKGIKVVAISHFPHKKETFDIEVYATELDYNENRCTGKLKGDVIEKGKIGIIKDLQKEYKITPENTIMVEDGKVGAFAKQEGVVDTLIAFRSNNKELNKVADYSTTEPQRVKEILEMLIQR